MKLNLGIHLSVPNNLSVQKKIGNSLQIMFNKNKLNADDIKSITGFKDAWEFCEFEYNTNYTDLYFFGVKR